MYLSLPINIKALITLSAHCRACWYISYGLWDPQMDQSLGLPLVLLSWLCYVVPADQSSHLFIAAGAGMGTWIINLLRPAIVRSVTVRQSRTTKRPTNDSCHFQWEFEIRWFSGEKDLSARIKSWFCLMGLSVRVTWILMHSNPLKYIGNRWKVCDWFNADLPSG